MARPNKDPNRAEKERFEEEWAASLAELLEEQYGDLLLTFGDRPTNPPRDWWEKWVTILAGYIGLSLFDIAQSSATSVGELIGIGADFDKVLAAAQEWSSQYSFGMVRNLNSVSERALQDLLGDYYGGRINREALESKLTAWFGPQRATNIAATEVTRGYEEGLSVYQNELRALGVDTDRVYRTEPGACPICAPQDGLLESEGWQGKPPLHPQCRCYTELVITPGQKAYREWVSR